MTTIIRGAEVTRPNTKPVRSSVLDHAAAAGNVSEVGGDFGKRNNAGLWPSYNCLDLLVPTQMCPDPTEDKVFDNAEWTSAFQFAVYGGVACNLVGLDRDDQAAEVRRVFEASEGKGVERALLANRFVERTLDDTLPLPFQVEWDAPVDLTPGSSVGLPVALALLEGYAARVYAAVPTIHMPVAASVVLEGSGLIVWDGDLAYTKNGSKVALGGGYDPDYAAPSDDPDYYGGALTMYATGEVLVEKSEQVTVNTYELAGSAASTALGMEPNTAVAFAERAYRVAVDCFTAQATGTMWS